MTKELTDALTDRIASAAELEDEARLKIEIRSVHDNDDLRELGHCLQDKPPWIPARFFYDARGSELFEEITELPEYYQTRTEETLLKQIAAEVVERSQATELLELGSGAATKTRTLLDAMQTSGRLRRYVPIDVDSVITKRIAKELLDEYPKLEIHAIITDLMEPLERLPQGHHRLVIFLGGTIGNLNDDACERFLSGLSAVMSPGDHFLLGVDLIKSKARLEAAYNDETGVTAAFNRNILRVVNSVAGSEFDPDAFEHVAIYNHELHRIEMWLKALQDQRVALPNLDFELELPAGEAILTEISTKYDRDLISKRLAHGGFEIEQWFTDAEELFGIALARRV